ncbi:HSDL2 protein, partial [Polyodon spathula]|nr:HSDL2 protein [Polyodon spathula]
MLLSTKRSASLSISSNSHILLVTSPPDTYTIAKYGMSISILGMVEEFRGEIGVNALFFHQTIQTAAMEMLGGSGIGSQCRKPEIVADAAYSTLTRPKTFTDDVHLTILSCIRHTRMICILLWHPLLPDFFLDDEPESLVQKMEEQWTAPIFKSGKAQKEAGIIGPVAETFNIIRAVLNPENDSGSAGSGDAPVKADVVMTLDSADFVKMFTGKLKPTMAFMTGKLKIKADLALTMKMEKMMAQLKPKL